MVVKEREIGEKESRIYIHRRWLGFSTWKNVGGMDTTEIYVKTFRMLERKEYFKEELGE